MAWKIEFIPNLEKQLKKIPISELKKIFDFLKKDVSANPRAYGKPLKGNLSEYWRYRIGIYRIIVKIYDEQMTVLVVRIGHRKEIYESK